MITYNNYIDPSPKVLDHIKNVLVFNVAQPESNEKIKMTEIEFIIFQSRNVVKNKKLGRHRR